jgi:hypothetical protein
MKCESLQNARLSAESGGQSFYDFNPLEFWNIPILREESFQPIRDSALVALSAPAGTGGVEATGSILNRTVTTLTNSLTDEHVEQMVIISSFIRDVDFDFSDLVHTLEEELRLIHDNQ